MSKERLIGAWKLERWTTQYEDGRLIYPMGEDATGFLLYTPDDHMAAFLSRGQRPAFTTGEQLTAAAEEKVRGWDSYFSYCGSFSVDGDRVIHRVETCQYPNWVGQVQERVMRFEGDHLHLLTPPQKTRRGLQTSTVVWHRAFAAGASRMSETLEGPVDWEGVVLRLAKLPDGSGRVEAWSEGGWRPAAVGSDKLFDARMLSPAEAAVLGIPASDLAPPRR